jgi:hypothetical protein
VHTLIDRYQERPWLLQIPVRGAPVTPSERGFPVLAGMLAQGQYEDGPVGVDIDFGLDRILDGIEVRIAAQATEQLA